MPKVHIPLPPGPSTSAVWQLLRYTLAPLSYLEGCARSYGDPFTMRLAGYGTLVMLASPDAVRDVFRGDPHVLHSGEGNEYLSLTVGNTSLFVLDDEPHARQRRLLLPPLKGERMRSFFGIMQGETMETVRGWPLRQPIRMVEPMQRITLRVILRAVLGDVPADRFENIAEQVNRFLQLGRSPLPLLIIPMVPRWLIRGVHQLPFIGLLRGLDEALFALIKARRQELPEARGDNVLADLLAARDEEGQSLSDQQIRDAIVSLVVAGHDTTSLALAWALEQIIPRADVVGRITEELQQATGGGPVQAEHLDQLHYLDAAIRESLRVRTILSFVLRLTKRPFVAGGREYPAGVILCPCNHLVHRREDLYPEPTRFRPGRFLERKYAAHEWFPFGGGNRMCLGMAFALYEMKVVLATLLGQVRLSRPAGSRSRPIRRGLSLAPDDGAQMLVMGRV